MRSARVLLVTAVLLLVGLLSAGPASAFWAGAGTGTGVGSVATLSPPTDVAAAASTGTGTVRVSWTPGTAPGGGAVDGYYVQRFAGSTPGPACATSPTTLRTGAACDDTGVANGTYIYRVTAVFRSWTAQSLASGAVTVARVDHLTVTAPGSATAGALISVTVTARDASGTVVAGYLGTVRFTSTDPRATVPADYTFSPSDAGTRTFAGGVRFLTGGSQAVTAADTVQAALTATAPVAVSAGPPGKLAFAQQPTSATAGATIAPGVVVRIEDAYGNLTSSTAGVGLTVTGGTATLSGTTTRAGVAGVARFDNLFLTAAGTYTLTATGTGLTGATSSSFTIGAAAASKLCVIVTPPACSAPTLTVAKGSTTPMQIGIVDQYGNPATRTAATGVTLTGAGEIDSVTPATVTIGTGSSTSGGFSVTIKDGNNRTGSVTASATGLTSASLTLSSPA